MRFLFPFYAAAVFFSFNAFAQEAVKSSDPVGEPAKIAEKMPQLTKIEILKLEQAKQQAHQSNSITKPTMVEAIPVQADSRIQLVFDRAKVMNVPKGVASLIVGNPLIADVALQPNGIIVLTGKGNGTTNMIALDNKGNTMFEKLLTVMPAREQMVSVYRADNRETLTCNPRCHKTPTVGDSSETFDQAINQANTRNGIIAGANKSGER
jgi:Pilus formation protein N terminal region